MPEKLRDDVILSFYRVRQALGIMGFLLPILLIVGGFLSLGGVEPSISDYYHTLLRDILVGTLCAIAVFLICYRGHGAEGRERFSDDLVTTIAGIAALGVAFLPNEGGAATGEPASIVQVWLGARMAAVGHYVLAAVFLFCLSYLALIKFSRTASPGRRRIYRSCGWTILVMTVGMVTASYFKLYGPPGPQSVVNDYVLILWFEAMAIWAFAFSWLTKGRTDRALIQMLHLDDRRRRKAAPRPSEDDEARI